MEVVTLDSIADVMRGITFSKSEGSLNSEEGLLPVLRAGSIQQELLTEKGLIWVPSTKIKENQVIRKNDIIMCTSSGSPHLVGKCAKASHNWIGSFSAFCAGIRADVTKCNPAYLYYFLAHIGFQGHHTVKLCLNRNPTKNA